MTESKKKKSKGSPLVKAILIGLLLIFSAIFWILSLSIFRTYPVENNVQLLSIQKGQTYSAFIDDLAEKNIVKFPIILKIYQRYFIDDSLKAGVYEIHKNTTVREVLVLLSDANNAQMNRVMVIEGTTFKQLKAALLKDNNVKKTILHLSDAEIMQKLGSTYVHPEGLFAPDTYFFAKGETDLNILKNLYNIQIKNIDQVWEKRNRQLPYKNKYEMLTMASIIEKETAIEEERTKVAGVFVRRLEIGMRLQTDPTVIYGMGDSYNGNITRQDLRTPTAYNTYTINGLPPTPIALPSLRSMQAAVNPDESDYIYFVATGLGGHKFSTNLADHNRAVQEYLKVIKAKREAN